LERIEAKRRLKEKIETFFVLDFGLDIVDGIAALDLEGDGLPRQGFHKDLHLAGWLTLDWRCDRVFIGVQRTRVFGILVE